MNRMAVNCTELASVGYNPRILVLELEFIDGEVHTYFQVPNDIFEALMSAEDHGQYYVAHIKHQFKFRKVS
jgi:hypothetical protein